MAKIIKISDERVYIGRDDKTILECRTFDLDFEPELGKEVDIYEDDYETIITEKNLSNRPRPRTMSDNINIHIENSNTVETQYKQGKVVSKAAYLLLTFFLGGLGIHKFYAGKPIAGIFYLIFCWTYVPGIIAFFEFIFACFKTSDSNGNIVV